MLALILAAAVAHAGWEETDRKGGCVFFKASAPEASGALPLRAECDWAVEPKTLQHLLGRAADHDLYFNGITKCEELARSGATTTVWQLHENPGITSREVVIDLTESDIVGGKRYAWDLAADQSHNSGQSVAIPLNKGMWEVTDKGDGTSHVVYELRYLAGGKVPGFMVRWFQGAGVQAVVLELKAYAEKSGR
jgi:hypothetical protein